jgi:hypothetical protein
VFQVLRTIIKWISLPALLIGSPFSRFAESYQPALDVVICLAAILIVHRAASVKKYYWAAGFVAVVIVFSPLVLVVKIFMLTGFTCLAAPMALVAAWKRNVCPPPERRLL